MSSIGEYITKNFPRDDMVLVQIIELYKGGYVGLRFAKDLMAKHAGDISHLVDWARIRRELKEVARE